MALFWSLDGEKSIRCVLLEGCRCSGSKAKIYLEKGRLGVWWRWFHFVLQCPVAMFVVVQIVEVLFASKD